MDTKRKWSLKEPDTRRHRNLRRLLRAGLVVAAAALCLFVASRIAAPYLVSSNVVRSAMERAVSQWTGHHATVDGTPELRFWPEPRITIASVTITRDSPSGPKVLGHVERISAQFGLYDAIRGRPVFSDFQFSRPQIFVDRDRNGHLDWTSEGMLSAAVRGATASNDTEQTLDGALDARIGSVTVEEGSLVLRDEASGKRFTIDGISADISWPRLSQALSARMLLRVGGRDLRFDFSSPQPLLLFGGKDARARATVDAAALTGTFNGIANLANGYFLSGPIELASTDIPALIAWSGGELPGTETLKQASLQANLTKIGANLRLENLKFSVDDIRASGIMELAPENIGKPRVSGTLAFDQLNIGGLLGAFSLRLPFGEAPTEKAVPGLSEWLDFDLTLSAEKAALKPFALQNIAASIMTKAGKAKFDIADSVFEGGKLTGHLVGNGIGFEGGGSLQISARNADLANVIKQLHLEGPLPYARGSVDLSLRSDRPLWSTRLSDISGSFQLHAGAGSLQNVDVDAIRTLALDRSYFRLSDAGASAMDFSRIDISAEFADGSADVSQARLVGTRQSLSVTGVVPYASNSLALSAKLSANDPAMQTALPPLRFFIGGSWPDPILSPVHLPEPNQVQ